MAKGGIVHEFPIWRGASRHAKLVAKGGIKTFGQFCAALRATPNRVAKGGIEPPTHGFSGALCNCARLPSGAPVYDESSS